MTKIITKNVNINVNINANINNSMIADIPQIGLGTYKLKTLEEIIYSMNHAIQSGYKMFDTAELYKNEKHISYFIKNELPKYNLSRKDIWITTKVAYFTMLEGAIKIKNIIQNSIELFEGYVDLFLIHATNHNDIITWNILREFQREGKIRYIGISNYNVEKLDQFIQTIGPDEAKMIYANQIEFNPFLHRKELVKKCINLGIRIIAYGSLYKSNEYIANLGIKYSRTPEQILLQWASSNKGIIVIPMSRNKEHIQDNINCLDRQECILDRQECILDRQECILDRQEIDILDNFNEGYTRFQKHL
jgi:diketogulonate reductase-like aldo/keto reductase